MPSFRFVLAASHAGEERDIWRLVREPNQVVLWTAKYPEYHHTMKNGERPHFTAQDGIDSSTAPIHPSLVAALQEAHPDVEKVKHHPMGT